MRFSQRRPSEGRHFRLTEDGAVVNMSFRCTLGKEREKVGRMGRNRKGEQCEVWRNVERN